MSIVTGLINLTSEQESEKCCGLSWTERLIAFACCSFFALFAGIVSIAAISLLRIRKFALLFTIMNIMLFSALSFLVGIKKQLSSLFVPKRLISSILMIIGIILTLFFAFVYKTLIGVIIGFLIEFVSFCYYALSYIPMGSALFHKIFF